MGALRCSANIQLPEPAESQCVNCGWNRYSLHRLVYYKHLGIGRAKASTHQQNKK